MSTPKTPYRVGYRQPPTETQYRKGKSGNPRGRPKGTKNFASALQQLLDGELVVNERGKRVTRSKRDVIAALLINKALGGDLKAAELVMKLSTLASAEGGGVSPDLAADRAMAELLVARLIRGAESAAETAEDIDSMEDSDE